MRVPLIAAIFSCLLMVACESPENGHQESAAADTQQLETTADTSKPAAVDAARIINADAEPHNWLSHGRTYSEQRFTPLHQINADNVEQLGLAWHFEFPTNRGIESTPILEKAAETWKGGEWWKIGGGGTVWDSMAYDPELDLLYFGVGNGAPWNRQIRSPGGGDNLFLSSLVAVKPDTGGYVWHYQTTPGETWDYTATQHLILADLEIEGKPRKVIMQAPNNGFFYVLDLNHSRDFQHVLHALPYQYCKNRVHGSGLRLPMLAEPGFARVQAVVPCAPFVA